MPKIHISQRGKAVGNWEVAILAGADQSMIPDAFYDEAWKAAVEDGKVDPNRRTDYDFQLLLDPPAAPKTSP